MSWYTYADDREQYRASTTETDSAALATGNPLLYGANYSKAIDFLSRAGTAAENDMSYQEILNDAASIRGRFPNLNDEELNNNKEYQQRGYAPAFRLSRKGNPEDFSHPP